VTDGNGCQNTASQSVTVTPLPVVSITPSSPTTSCFSNSVVLDATRRSADLAWNTTPVQNTRTINVAASGNYSVTVADGNGCQNTASQSVTVNPPSTALFRSSGPTTFCFGNSVVLDAGAGFASYAWNTTPVQNTRTIHVAASGNYSVTVTDGNGCQNTASQSVTVNPLPVVSITPSGPTTFCFGNSVVLDAGAGFASYAWNTTPVQNTRTINVAASGNYSVTVTDGNGCQNTASQSVTVNPLPVVSITPSGPTTFCFGNSVVLDAGAGFASYAWNTTPAQHTPLPNVAASGNYSVT